MAITPQPSLPGFLAFIRGVMGIDPLLLPDDAPVIAYAFAVAIAIVNPLLRTATWYGPWCFDFPSPPPLGVPRISIYAMAVYNLAGSNVINYAPDQPGRKYFHDARKDLGIAPFQPGVVASTGDTSTSVALLNPEFMKNLTLANLQQLKDPWGRAYLGFAQSYGPSIVDIS